MLIEWAGKHLTFALLCCYNNTLGVYRGRPRLGMELRGTQDVHYNNPRFFGTAKDSAKLTLEMI
jgi:hypothetical protein